VDLLARSCAGDQAAFAELFDRHGGAVYRYAFGLTRDVEQARDLVQETFLTAWRRRGEITLHGPSLLPWLLVCARQHRANLRRRDAVRLALPLDELADRTTADAGARDDTDGWLEVDWVSSELARLSETDRQIVELCLFDDLSYADAAVRLGLTVHAVTKRVQRIRDRLRARRAATAGGGR
jgi:RNA polymerase sigma-70 factor (ECF subfamily)